MVTVSTPQQPRHPIQPRHMALAVTYGPGDPAGSWREGLMCALRTRGSSQRHGSWGRRLHSSRPVHSSTRPSTRPLVRPLVHSSGPVRTRPDSSSLVRLVRARPLVQARPHSSRLSPARQRVPPGWRSPPPLHLILQPTVVSHSPVKPQQLWRGIRARPCLTSQRAIGR